MTAIKARYDDCPYKCNASGKILDTVSGQMVPCPHCFARKQELMKGGEVETVDDEIVPLSMVLGIESEFLSTKFVYETVIPDGELLFIDEESVSTQRDIAEELYHGLTIGNLPEESFCFGISIKGRAERFAYPMLAKAYMSGLNIGKFLSCSEYNRLTLDANSDILSLYECDFLMMLINEGSTLADISSAKGLMQTRSLKGKPTVFITTWTIEACSALLGYYDNDSLSLATPVFVEYKTTKKKGHSHYINKLLGVENDYVDSGSDSGSDDASISYGSNSASVGSKGVSMADLLGN